LFDVFPSALSVAGFNILKLATQKIKYIIIKNETAV